MPLPRARRWVLGGGLCATEQDVDPKQLSVENGQLRVGANHAPLEGIDHLLFRLEVTEQGPEYRSLGAIAAHVKAASEALKDQDLEKADGFYRAAIIAAHEAPGLTTADRTRVKTQLKDDYAGLKNDLGFAGLIGEDYDLSKRMQLAMSVDQALSGGEPSWSELFDV